MSMYNMVNKIDPAVFFLLPLLDIHPDDLPRFRDCFSTRREFRVVDELLIMVPADPKETPAKIYVLCRVGGGNREEYAEQIVNIRNMPDYLEDYDDPLDSTYTTFIFQCPEQWKDDYAKVCTEQYRNTSDAYKVQIKKMYPKLEEKLDRILK